MRLLVGDATRVLAVQVNDETEPDIAAKRAEGWYQ